MIQKVISQPLRNSMIVRKTALNSPSKRNTVATPSKRLSDNVNVLKSAAKKETSASRNAAEIRGRQTDQAPCLAQLPSQHSSSNVTSMHHGTIGSINRGPWASLGKGQPPIGTQGMDQTRQQDGQIIEPTSPVEVAHGQRQGLQGYGFLNSNEQSTQEGLASKPGASILGSKLTRGSVSQRGMQTGKGQPLQNNFEISLSNYQSNKTSSKTVNRK